MRISIQFIFCCGLLALSTNAYAASAGQRAPIYKEDGKGMERVEEALHRAQERDTHVLLKIGGNWCGWCFKLDDVFHNEESVRSLLEANYEVVLIDSAADTEVVKKWSITPQGYPYLAVLDASGNKLTEQETGALEIGPKHDPAKVAAFLEQWKPTRKTAEEKLHDAFQLAKESQRKVFVRVGAPWCGWCRRLDDFVAQPDIRARLEKDLVLLKLDVEKTEGAEAVVESIRKPSEGGGIPWFAFLNEDSSILVTSTAENGGNIGFPVDPQTEIPHFVRMLKLAQARMTDDDIAAIELALTKK